ncbi:acyltransferase family protein [Actinomycetaceae bacterium UMB8039B]|uniref:acyltransferase family protein n=1 Tax=unclassified Pauljensenia TaxID=2908895 RepID=UPI002551624D|nr:MULTISPECIES: acyltransferase family protein [unclassified Pauljensenia]MDK7780304.1 acyltransferase family protein [Actinomycetaceae bacterium UMB8041B]MDK8293204.1 acyltransferase family protein [Actinomycetaceae bacterium UMB8039B]MDK8608650.1 acyltransferase family protein [Actinomycetaceae bacterium UMB8041A]MDK8752581.1 acyltransferase family protein [Actinomycetaceae bacterium UMB8039A]MDK6830910.1 acyltransferase family protein [Pauljensenia sp. UMB8040A]
MTNPHTPSPSAFESSGQSGGGFQSAHSDNEGDSSVGAASSTPSEPTPTLTTRRRLQGLDGIRGIAAMFVLVYHLLPQYAKAGFAGVDIFFVLSGFLITLLLIDRLDSTGSLGIGHFWIRRFRRLVPAAVTTCIGAGILALLSGTDALVALPRQVVGVLTGTYNWLEIISGASYFEQQSPLLLTNAWSFAVEQQFYVIWPLILLLLVRLPKHLRIWIALGIGGASTAWHAVLVGQDLSRAYMGTDTHLWGLMIGAALAFAVPNAMQMVDERAKHAGYIGFFGVISFFATMFLMTVLPESFMYPWGMVIVSLATAFTIRGLLPDVSYAGTARLLRKVLELRPLVWLGERSYGIYLWHWPLWVLAFYVAPQMSLSMSATLVSVASVLFAALSYRFIETPIRRVGFLQWCRIVWSGFLTFTGKVRIVIAVIVLVIASLFAVALCFSPNQSSAQIAIEQGAMSAPASDAMTSGSQSADAASSGDQSQSETQSDAQSGAQSGEPEFIRRYDYTQPQVTGEEITIIGDSVTLGSSAALSEAFPGVYVDAEVSRSVLAAGPIIDSLNAQGLLREYVVISLATNAVVTDDQIDALVAQIGPERKLILVTAFGPARTTWIPPSNDTIWRAATRYRNVFAADWANPISRHPEDLAGDSVHPATDQGHQIYVEAIRSALNEALQISLRDSEASAETDSQFGAQSAY